MMNVDLQRLVDHALAALGRAGNGLGVLSLLQQTPHKCTLLAKRAGQRFVLRIDRPGGAVPGLSRPAELAILHWAAAADLGPAIVASAPGVLLLHHLDGRSWTADDLLDPQRLARAGQLLRRLHEAGRGGGAGAWAAPMGARAAGINPLLPSLTELTQAYASHINTAAAHATAAQILKLLPEPGPGELTLCHRDPIAPNLLETPAGELKLLDWEYAGPGDPLYDLAVIIEHHALDEAAAATLLTSWAGGDPAGDLSRRLERARQACRLVVDLWEKAVAASRAPEHS
jgi:thiamine kinase-like enzyme